jgi:hypothetical protein
VLPREEAWHERCGSCEREVHRREGPQAARPYQFVARGIAGALATVGAGSTYRRASLIARERARRVRFDPATGQLRETRHGQLVADWVEVFAPVVFEAHRPERWPDAGTLVIDDLPFRVRDPQNPGLQGCLPRVLRDGLRGRQAHDVADGSLHRRVGQGGAV